MQKAIIFVRVSTERQDLSEQELALVQLAERDGYAQSQQILISYKESAIRLSEEARLGLSDLKQYILSDESINAVYAAEISRIARSKKVLFSIEEFLVSHKVQLVILTPSIRLLKPDNTVDDAAEFAFTMWAQFAESEMRLKKQRFSQARERNRKLGRFNGGRTGLGFTTDDSGFIVQDETTVPVIIELFKKYQSGYSIVKLRNWLSGLGIFYTGQNIKGMLSRDAYRKIVGEQLWVDVQELRQQRKNTGEDRHRKYSICERLIICPECGHFYTLRSNHVYNCVYHDCQRRNTEQFCPNSVGVSQRRIEAICIAVAARWKSNFMAMNEAERRREAERRNLEIPLQIKELERKLNNVKIKKRRLTLKFVDVLIGERTYEERMEKLNSEESGINMEISRLNAELTYVMKQPVEIALDVLESVDKMTQEELYFLVHEQISRISLEVLNKGKILTLFGKNGNTEMYRFQGQARAFRCFRMFDDGEEMDITESPMFAKR